MDACWPNHARVVLIVLLLLVRSVSHAGGREASLGQWVRSWISDPPKTSQQARELEERQLREPLRRAVEPAAKPRPTGTAAPLVGANLEVGGEPNSEPLSAPIPEASSRQLVFPGRP